jgi:hypothetical protein
MGYLHEQINWETFSVVILDADTFLGFPQIVARHLRNHTPRLACRRTKITSVQLDPFRPTWIGTVDGLNAVRRLTGRRPALSPFEIIGP